MIFNFCFLLLFSTALKVMSSPDWDMNGEALYVGNILHQITEDDFKKLFGQVETFEEVDIRYEELHERK
ncbi:hypothetical protein PRIPAC_76339 [Pristionchus pacificus]|uniref:RNA binding protein n=1 Tax=Pristionchus pacificus TaxID=54126 RepID=A0A2A6C0S8_PRIPA|nr:hypothetical protein PRIPAC_76339 [Pristionchus pacificus]|eukprot:PDM71623.1 RNA binding protein [Pristionchus pacificus]